MNANAVCHLSLKGSRDEVVWRDKASIIYTRHLLRSPGKFGVCVCRCQNNFIIRGADKQRVGSCVGVQALTINIYDPGVCIMNLVPVQICAAQKTSHFCRFILCKCVTSDVNNVITANCGYERY